MKWLALEMPGRTVCEVHVMPLGDKRMHTAPICWCLPHRGSANIDCAETSERIWTHNAILSGT